MKTFISTHKLFQIELPENWQSSFQENIYTFQYEENSALQVSAMFHPGGKLFVLGEEFEKEHKKHPTAQIVQLSEYEAVHYALDLVSDKMLQYVWITGFKNVKLFCTLTINSQQADEKLDADYQQCFEILDTVRILPTIVRAAEVNN